MKSTVDWMRRWESDPTFARPPFPRLSADKREGGALARSYAACGEITADYAKTFYLGTKLMTPEKARAIWAIYVWCRRTDELVDGPNAPRMTPAALDRWEERLEAAWRGKPYDVLDAALSDTVAAFPVDIQPFRDMVRKKLVFFLFLFLVLFFFSGGEGRKKNSFFFAFLFPFFSPPIPPSPLNNQDEQRWIHLLSVSRSAYRRRGPPSLYMQKGKSRGLYLCFFLFIRKPCRLFFFTTHNLSSLSISGPFPFRSDVRHWLFAMVVAIIISSSSPFLHLCSFPLFFFFSTHPLHLLSSSSLYFPSFKLHTQNIQIDGMRMDLTKARYATYEELYEYCYRVAGAVGLMTTPVMGVAPAAAADPEPTLRAALALGTANQLTNILRDVGEDAQQRNRVYVPLEDLDRFGIAEAEVVSGSLVKVLANGKSQVDPRWKRFMAFQIARARACFADAEAGIGSLDADARWPVWSALILYRQILDSIEKNDYDNFTKRAYVTKWRKYASLPAALMKARQGL